MLKETILDINSNDTWSAKSTKPNSDISKVEQDNRFDSPEKELFDTFEKFKNDMIDAEFEWMSETKKAK